MNSLFRLYRPRIFAIVLTMLALVAGGARAADPSTLYVSENSLGLWIASKDSYLYWYIPACGPELLPPAVFIRVSPPFLPAHTVFNPIECPTTTMFGNTRIAIDDTDLYWADNNNHIVRLSRWATPPTPATIFSPYSAQPRELVELAVDDTFVYWLESRSTSGRVVRIPKVAGAGSPLAWTVNQTTNLTTLRIDPLGRAYVLSNGTLTQLVPDPSSVTFTPQPIGAPGLVSQYAVAGDRIYWIESDASHQRQDVKSAPLASPTQIAQHWTITFQGNVTVQDLIVDATNVYWIENRPARTYAVMRLPRSGGAAVELAGYGPNSDSPPYQLVAIGSYLFWSLPSKGQIRRLPIVASGLDLTSEGRGPMVVQVVQGPSNDMPLIAGKSTVVQAFGRIDPATTALTSIVVNPSSSLAGTRDGQALPGSPLSPRSNLIQLKSDPIDIRDVDTSMALSQGLTFDLPESWTHGTITLTATLNPGHTTPETTLANNVASSTVTFQDQRSYCLWFVPIETETSTITGPSAALTSFLDRASSVFPLVEFQTNFMGGPGLRRPQLPFGQGSDPWRLDTDIEMSYLLWTMWWTNVFNTGFACAGEGNVVLGAVAQSVRYGMSSPGVLTFLMSPGADAIASPYEGLAGIAHELGHEFGRAHIACPASGPGAPANTDGAYPHPPCLTDSNTSSAHVGYDTLLDKWMLPGATADMMTYSRPLWISDYTYKALAQALNLQTALRLTTPAAAGASSSALIGGLLGAAPLIGFAFPIDQAQARSVNQRLEGRALPSSELELHVRDVRGVTLSQAPLNTLPIVSEGGPQASMFFNLIDLPAGATRLDVVRRDGTTVLSRSAGPSLPRVTISQPKKGATIAKTLNIRWSGSDPDHDPLLYSVRYSHDDGKTWRVLAVNVNERSLEVPAERLPGGSKALVEVVVSDGLHFAKAIAGPFEMKRKVPEVAIRDARGRNLSPQHPAAIAQSRPLVLRGYAYDAEDGQIGPGALQWTLAGAAAASANGANFRVNDLPPGRYRATLETQDSDKNRTRSSATVTVLPKRIPDTPEAVQLDGHCDDLAYTRDDDPLRLRMGSGSAVEAHVVRTENALLVCFAGLPLAGSATEVVGLRVRWDAHGGNRLTPNDHGFLVGSNGKPIHARGTRSGGWSIEAVPTGFAASVSASDRSWSAEMKIDLPPGIAWDHAIRLQAVHYTEEHLGHETVWPRDSHAIQPRTWGEAILGRVPQHISFPALPDVRSGMAAIDLVATASSGLPVEYSAGGSCILEGDRLAIKGTGACTVVAKQAGNASYTPARSISRSFLACPAKVSTFTKRQRLGCVCTCGRAK